MRVVESEPIEDGGQDPVVFRKCFTVAEAHHMEAVRRQRSTALSVGRHCCWLVVLTAIELDNKPCFDTSKVGEVAADRVLAAKLVAVETPIPQVVPDRTFGVG